METDSLRICARCGLALPAEALRYAVRLDVFADALGIGPGSALGEAATPEFEALLGELERMDEAALLEEEKRVFERFSFSLCPPCRQRLRERLWALARGEETAAPEGETFQ